MAMAWYEEIAYAEPTIVGSVGAGFVHLLFWLCVTSWEFGLAKHLDVLLRTRFPSLYHGTIRKNYEGKDDLEVWGLDKEPEIMFISSICTILHHGTAGLLMATGMFTQSTWLWRHGLLTQLFGCDILDFARIAWCVMLPPGPWPVRVAIQNNKYLTFIGLHHSTSLLAGIPVTLYFADHPEFQFMGFLLAGGPIFTGVIDLAIKVVDARYLIVHGLVEVVGSFVFSYQRCWMYFRLAFALLQIVYASSIPMIAKVSLTLGGLMMSFFNLMIMPLIFQSLKKLADKVRGKRVEKVCNSEEDVQQQTDARTMDVHEEQQGELPTLLRNRQPLMQQNKMA